MDQVLKKGLKMSSNCLSNLEVEGLKILSKDAKNDLHVMLSNNPINEMQCLKGKGEGWVIFR